MKFGIKFMSCSDNSNFAIIATMSGIIPKVHSHPCSLINTVATFIKVKISDFQTRFHDEYLLFAALLTPAKHAVKVENRSRQTYFVHFVVCDSLSG